MSSFQGGLIERGPVIERIRSAVDEVRTGTGTVVVLEGPAGIGKSRMVNVAVEIARGADMQVLSARGGELERDVTFGIARQLFERLLHEAADDERQTLTSGSAALALSALNGPIASQALSPETGPAHGLYWLVSNIAQRGPVALVVDDCHWSDAESLRFLTYLSRRLEGLPVFILLTARPREPSPAWALLDMLAAEAGGGVVALQALTEEGAAAMLEDRLGALPDGIAEACHEATGGNPFFIHEIAAHLDVSRGRGPAATVEQIRGLLPPAVTRSILLRLGRQDAATRAVGVALAVLGVAPSIGVLAATAQLDSATTIDAFSRLLHAGLANPTGLPSLAHPIIRTAIYADLPEVQRRHQHRLAAAALMSAQAGTEEIANHLLVTEPDGDAQVAGVLLDAGYRATARGAPDTAAQLFARALREPPPHARRTELLIALGQAELAAGARAAAVAHLRDALTDDMPSAARAAAVLTLSRALAEAEGQQSAIDALRGSVQALEPQDALLVDLEQSSLSLYMAEHRAAALERLRVYAGLPGDTPTERFALAVAGLSYAFDASCHVADVARIATLAWGDGRLINEQTSDSPVPSNAMYCFLYAEEFDRVDMALEQTSADARARGSVFGFFTIALSALIVAVLRGDTATAIVNGEAAVGLLPDVPQHLVMRAWAGSMARFTAEAMVHRGDLDGARRLIEHTLVDYELDTVEGCLLRYARGLLSEATGEHRAALDDFLSFGALVSSIGWETRDAPWRLGAARAAAAVGQQDRARELADEAVQIARAVGRARGPRSRSTDPQPRRTGGRCVGGSG